MLREGASNEAVHTFASNAVPFLLLFGVPLAVTIGLAGLGGVSTSTEFFAIVARGAADKSTATSETINSPALVIGSIALAAQFFVVMPLAGIATVLGVRRAAANERVRFWSIAMASWKRLPAVVALEFLWFAVVAASAVAVGLVAFVVAVAVGAPFGITGTNDAELDRIMLAVFAVVFGIAGVAAWPIFNICFAHAFVGVSAGDGGAIAGFRASFQTIFRRVTFWRAVAVSLGAIALTVFAAGFEAAVAHISVRWPQLHPESAIVTVLVDASAAALATIVFATFYSDLHA